MLPLFLMKSFAKKDIQKSNPSNLFSHVLQTFIIAFSLTTLPAQSVGIRILHQYTR